MSLITLKNLSLAFGTHALLDSVNLTVHGSSRIGLLGRNGAGKSSFLKLLSGHYRADSGELSIRSGATLAYLDQELPAADDKTVYEVVASGLDELGKLLKRFHDLTLNTDEFQLDELSRVQEKIEAANGWLFQQRIDSIMTSLQLPSEKLMRELSGGWRRRVALARALVAEPDILLLDEPTNHLDIPMINWLQSEMQRYSGTLVFITHDRAFLQAVATKIIELDRGKIRQWNGDYRGFLKFQADELAAEETAAALFDKKLAEEEKWIRKGIQARRTRNEGRVRALKKLREEHQARRDKLGKAQLSLDRGELSGKLVAKIEHVTHGYGDDCLIQDFSMTLLRGDRVGIIGPNGAGKTTLLRILLGDLQPDSGTVQLGTKVQLSYFDQRRNQLQLDKTVIDNLAEGREFIEINGKERHVISYLQDFLFPPEKTRQPASTLSGGERNRLILAKLFSTPTNVLVLDEPTNDLDMETLELLEDLLLSYKGTVLLVSHDRVFMDNVVTSCIAFEGNGNVSESIGNFSDWERRGGSLNAAASKQPAKKKPVKPADKPKPVKLSHNLAKELGSLPQLIEKAERKQATLSQQISATEFYDQPQETVDKILADLTQTQAALELYYARWSELEAMQQPDK